MFQYSPLVMLEHFKANQELISAYFKGEAIEGFKSSSPTILGMPVGLFILSFVITILLYILAVIYLISKWNRIGVVGQVLSIVALCGILGGPIGAILIVYIASSTGGWPSVR